MSLSCFQSYEDYKEISALRIFTLQEPFPQEAANAIPAEIVNKHKKDKRSESPQKQRLASVTQQNLKPPLSASLQAKAAARAPLKLPAASTLQLNLSVGSQAGAKHMPAIASCSKKVVCSAATSSDTIAKKVQAAPSSFKSAMSLKSLAPPVPTNLRSKVSVYISLP